MSDVFWSFLTYPSKDQMSVKVDIATKVLLGPGIQVKLATYKLSLSALTGQTKCKQTQLVGCKFD